MITKEQIENYKQAGLESLRKQLKLTPEKLVSVTFDVQGTHVCFMIQNKAKSSKWAQLARDGHEVVQVIITKEGGKSIWKYYGVMVDGKLTVYSSFTNKSKVNTNETKR